MEKKHGQTVCNYIDMICGRPINSIRFYGRGKSVYLMLISFDTVYTYTPYILYIPYIHDL